jgi:putative peptidoglycan lipid II flippase
MSFLSRTSLLLAVFFGLGKVVALLSQVIIARQFGLSSELDSFNVANNLPDMLFALISGGALAMAFIPVLSEVLTQDGRKQAWDLFSRIANLAFIVTAIFAVIIAILAAPLVSWELGIAPGFNAPQQELVVSLMRLNLIATLIFSISGLVMAGLQANQHFLLPAMAPLMYNVGQIFGAVVLSPSEGYVIAGITLPAFGFGVYGLVYGVIVGALLHLGIQVPGLIAYRFQWVARIGIHQPAVQKVLRLLVPRLATMLLIQLIFIVRDNLASRLAEGAVTALTYGYMVQQVPETLIGTAIGTAILPTLAEQVSRKDWEMFRSILERAIRVLVALTIPVAVILSVGMRPLLSFAFGFDEAGTDLLLWVARGFLAGLLGHSLLEIAARSFYAQQDAVTPLIGAAVNVTIYISLGSLLYRPLGAPGIGLTDSIAFTVQALFLITMLLRKPFINFNVKGTVLRVLPGALAACAVVLAVQFAGAQAPPMLVGLVGMAAGGLIVLPFIWKEIRVLLRL